MRTLTSTLLAAQQSSSAQPYVRVQLAARDLGRIALAGFLGITIYHTALNFGEVSVDSGAAALIIAAGPVFTALLSVILRPSRS